MKTLAWAAAATILALAGASAAAPAPVKTTGGMVQGVEGDGAVSYKGIPYAKPPVGDLRWRPPQTPAPWTGIKLADHYGDACMQNAPPLGAPAAISEDCLYLNVWTPDPRPAGKAPVMVWIHGGGFNIGSSSWPQTEGSSLSRRGVVLVSLNYRMGKFGFFAHPALTQDAKGEELGNYGIMDMIAALKWVHANVAAFGGDPDNVTIFGELAGGMAVNFLMELPDARGLFEKAIVESGTYSPSMADLKTAEAAGETAAQAWGVTGDDLGALKAVPAKTVLGDATMTEGGAQPLVDGRVIPEPPLAAFKAGRIARVPYMVGANAYEAGIFPGMADTTAARFKADWPRIEAVYDGYGTHDPKLVAGELATDVFMTQGARAYARAATALGLPTYLYEFSYLRPSQRDGKLPGPLHFDEVYVVFDSDDDLPAPALGRQGGGGADAEPLDQFREDRRPLGGLAGVQAGDEQLLEFANDGVAVRKDFAKARLDLVESLVSQAQPAAAPAAAAK